MSNKEFINNLSSTYANVRKLNAKVVDAKKIKIDGENIENLWGLNLPKDYPKLISRCELPKNKPWALWTDSGDLVYFNQSEKIVNGKKMFNNCKNITTFDCDLSSLTNGESMFEGCINITRFTSDLSSLTDGYRMFIRCNKLTTFVSNLGSLTDGSTMFSGCPLVSFTSDLSSLEDGSGMFDGCKLDKKSVLHIIKCLKEKNTNTTKSYITIGMDENVINDEDILMELGATSGWTNATIQNVVGGTWSISRSGR